MRPIWSGALSFGLVNIPVKLYSPAAREKIDIDYLHRKDRSPVRYARVCVAEDKEIPFTDIVRGVEYEKGKHVLLTAADFKRANVRKTETISIIHFAKEDEIESLYFAKPYYAEPERGVEKPYALFREALERTGRVGVAEFVLRNREHLVILKPYRKLLLVNQLRYHAEIQPPSGLSQPDASVTKKELTVATELIERLTSPFDPRQHSDTYTDELLELVAEKSIGKTPRAKGTRPRTTSSRDLLTALRRSLKHAHRRVGVRARA
jgi:DNA end-binding protein Ku